MAWKINFIPEPETVTYTLGQFLDSIEMNGLPQKDGDYWHDGKWSVSDYQPRVTSLMISSACAIGQAALNLEVGFNELTSVINKEFRTKGRRGLADSIIGRNDGHRWSYKSIARYYRKKFESRLDDTFTVKRIISVDKESFNDYI